mmetsp:Transcript_91/g.244  ORF Transcript_91/g.244 Transcript_91/m.244 type:complete len:511 (-) Transcript_91:101-1633(-)
MSSFSLPLQQGPSGVTRLAADHVPIRSRKARTWPPLRPLAGAPSPAAHTWRPRFSQRSRQLLAWFSALVPTQRQRAKRFSGATSASGSAKEPPRGKWHLLQSVLVWTALYFWLTCSVDWVNITAQRFPRWEIPLYLLFAVLPLSVGIQQFVETSMARLFGRLSRMARGRLLKHTLEVAASPVAAVIDASLFFIGVNFGLQALPHQFRIGTPKYLHFLDPNHDGILTGLELRTGLHKYSLSLLETVVVTCVCQFFLRVKQPPKDYELHSDGVVDLFWRGIKERRGLIVLLDLGLTAAAISLTVLRWFRLIGISPQTVLAFGGVGGIALGFAAQTLVENVISGLLILVTRPFQQGDWIECEEVQGHVRTISWTLSEIETPEGPIITIPNSTLIQTKTMNRTVAERRTIRMEVPLPERLSSRFTYQAVLDRIGELAEEVVDKSGYVLHRPPKACLQGVDRENDYHPVVDVFVSLQNDAEQDPSIEQISQIRSDLLVAILTFVDSTGEESDEKE